MGLTRREILASALGAVVAAASSVLGAAVGAKAAAVDPRLSPLEIDETLRPYRERALHELEMARLERIINPPLVLNADGSISPLVLESKESLWVKRAALDLADTNMHERARCIQALSDRMLPF